MVTESKPLLRMPAEIPFPSIVWPLRSIVMPLAATTRPSQMQSARSFMTFVLCVSFLPQVTVVGTGAEPIVQVRVAGVGSALGGTAPSTARTAKVWVPTARSGYGFGEAQGCQAPPSSWHSNVALGSSLEKVKVAFV